MKKLLLLVVVLFFGGAAWVWASFQPPTPLAVPPPGATLSDVTLIEPGVGRQEHRRVTIAGDEIETIAAGTSDSDDPFAGAFVLPGLNDLHVHFPPPSLPGQSELWSFLFLLHGVTGVRDAGDVDGTSTGPARDGIESFAFPGPHIVSCGVFVDGDPPRWKNSLVVRTPEEGREAVARIVEQNLDCVKAYSGLDRESLDAIREAAHTEALPVIGHVPTALAFEEALLDDAQHLIGVPAPVPDEKPFPFNQDQWDDVDDARLDFVIQNSLENDLAHTPTLVTGERLAAMRDYEAMRREPDAALLPRFYRDVVWSPDGGVSPAGRMGPGDFDVMDRALAAKLRAVKRMYDAGVELHSGTDSLVAFVVPGASLHRELRLFVRAGLSPEQALAISTGSSAAFLGVAQLGLLRPGAPAELAIFREDPTRSLDALDSLIGVVRAGRLYTRADLDAQMERYRSYSQGWAYDTLLTPVVRRVVATTVGK